MEEVLGVAEDALEREHLEHEFARAAGSPAGALAMWSANSAPSVRPIRNSAIVECSSAMSRKAMAMRFASWSAGVRAGARDDGPDAG